MARNLFVYQNAAYEGELDLYRHAHVVAAKAQASTSVGLAPRYVYRMVDGDPGDAKITDDEVAVRRYLHDHPSATVELIRVVH